MHQIDMVGGSSEEIPCRRCRRTLSRDLRVDMCLLVRSAAFGLGGHTWRVNAVDLECMP